MILGECKYWKEPVGINILLDLEEKANNVAWEKERRKVWYVLFSAGGFTEELQELAQNRPDVMLVDDNE